MGRGLNDLPIDTDTSVRRGLGSCINFFFSSKLVIYPIPGGEGIYSEASQLHISRSPWYEPERNLALEEELFDRLAPGEGRFHLYLNDPCVVVGKNQNPWKECSLEVLESEKLPLLRRISGGGTVYHDRGNLNFSFMVSKDTYSKEWIHGFMLESLRNLGVVASVTDKGDYLCEGLKFSGNAMCIRQGKVLHHGTLLVDADLTRLGGVLHGLEGLKGPSVASRPSPVVNLGRIRLGLTVEKVLETLVQGFSLCGKVGAVVSETPLLADEGRIGGTYGGWEWNWGHTPDFQWRYGSLEVLVSEGRVARVFFDGKDQENSWGLLKKKFRPTQFFDYIRKNGLMTNELKE